MQSKEEVLASCNLTQEQLDSYWMPYTGNREYKKNPRMIVSAEGKYYTDAEGARYSIVFLVCGHVVLGIVVLRLLKR